jgi:hypothetical protein
MWKYDVVSSTWSQMQQNGANGVPDPRFGAVSWVSAEGRLILFGGNALANGQNNQRNDMWSYNTITNTWYNPTIALADSSTSIPLVDSTARWLDGSNTVWIFSGRVGTSLQYVNEMWALGTFSLISVYFLPHIFLISPIAQMLTSAVLPPRNVLQLQLALTRLDRTSVYVIQVIREMDSRAMVCSTEGNC